MKTDNEILAEFMGFRKVEVHNQHGVCYAHADLMGVYGEKAQRFRYDTSWDWLHPVLEKIEEQLDELKEESGIVPIFEDEYSHPWEMPMTTRIVDAHAAAVNLIKFLNANQQKP